MSELRKWLPLTLLTIATLLAVFFTYEYVERPIEVHDPMQEFLQ